MPKKSRAKILIVEDEAIIATSLQLILQELSYDVVGFAVSGKAAIDIATTEQPDICLMDVNIVGEMDGVETAITIRNELAIPSIFLTAYNNPELVERARKAQPLGYLTKPVRDIDLVCTLDMALAKNEVDRALTATMETLNGKIAELEAAAAEIERLRELKLVCAWCDHIRTDEGDWLTLTNYISKYLGTKCSHGICSDCKEKLDSGNLSAPKG